jgi:hypothetical protein
MGNFYRPGTLYTQATIETFDHDFPSLADGVVIPHGIDDLGYPLKAGQWDVGQVR